MKIDIKNKSMDYFNSFSEKNITKISNMFSSNVTLRDWDIEADGKHNVLEATENIFSSVDSISINIKDIYVHNDTTISELVIVLDGVEKILVVDIIVFNESGEICSIRAYKG
ncbi:hypothetical protein HOL24_01170 [bacterium]|jgi:hypothetical protein|nr:hypothetical protein [bacterium]